MAFKFKSYRKAPVRFVGGAVTFLPGEETEVSNEAHLKEMRGDRALRAYVGDETVRDLDGFFSADEAAAGLQAAVNQAKRELLDSPLPGSGITIDGKPIEIDQAFLALDDEEPPAEEPVKPTFLENLIKHKSKKAAKAAE